MKSLLEKPAVPRKESVPSDGDVIFWCTNVFFEIQKTKVTFSGRMLWLFHALMEVILVHRLDFGLLHRPFKTSFSGESSSPHAANAASNL